MHGFNLNSSQLLPMPSDKHDGSDEEEVVRVQKQGGNSGQCLILLLIIFAIIASKLLQEFISP